MKTWKKIKQLDKKLKNKFRLPNHILEWFDKRVFYAFWGFVFIWLSLAVASDGLVINEFYFECTSQYGCVNPLLANPLARAQYEQALGINKFNELSSKPMLQIGEHIGRKPSYYTKNATGYIFLASIIGFLFNCLIYYQSKKRFFPAFSFNNKETYKEVYSKWK